MLEPEQMTTIQNSEKATNNGNFEMFKKKKISQTRRYYMNEMFTKLELKLSQRVRLICFLNSEILKEKEIENIDKELMNSKNRTKNKNVVNGTSQFVKLKKN